MIDTQSPVDRPPSASRCAPMSGGSHAPAALDGEHSRSTETLDLLTKAGELYHAGEFRQAEGLCRSALDLSVQRSEAHRLLGAMIEAQGRLDEAIECYRNAIQANAANAEAHRQLAYVLGQQGQLGDAIEADRQALMVRPGWVGPLYHLTCMTTISANDAEFAALEALLPDHESLDEEDRALLFFALAKAYEDVGDYDRSFECLNRANRVRRQGIEYDVEADVRMLREIAEVFSEGLLDRLTGSGCSSNLPVLIVGMPRSGTTLVEQILASHSDIHGAGELWDLAEIATAVRLFSGGKAFPGGVEYLRPEELTALGQGYVERLRSLAPNATRVVDKDPLNFVLMGLVRLMLPNARIIHCTRDPLDTCLSCYKQNFRSIPFSFDLNELGQYYRGYTVLMDHWRRVLPAGSMLDVRYEDLVRDFEHHARRIVDHCGLGWDDRCLAFHSMERRVYTCSFAQVRQPIYRHAVERWRRYESHLKPLVSALAATAVSPRPA